MKKATQALKWTGTYVLIFGTLINSLGYYPLGPLLLSFGGLFWLIAAINQNDRPLIVTNVVLMLTGLGGVLYNVIVN